MTFVQMNKERGRFLPIRVIAEWGAGFSMTGT